MNSVDGKTTIEAALRNQMPGSARQLCNHTGCGTKVAYVVLNVEQRDGEASMSNASPDTLTSLCRGMADPCANASDFEFNTITDLDDILGLGEIWRTLEQQNESPYAYFQTYDWCISWLKQFDAGHASQNKSKARIFTVHYRGELVLLWPLMLDRSPIGLNCLTTLSMPHAQYSNVLMTPDIAGQEALRSCWERLKSTIGIDVIDLPKIPARTPLANVVVQQQDIAIAADVSSAMDLTAFKDWDQYVGTLSRNTRKGRNRRKRKLTELGPLSIAVHESGTSEFKRVVSECIRMKKVWLSEKGKISRALSWPGSEDFYSRLPRCQDGPDRALAFELVQDDKMIAGEFGYEYKGHYISYLGAFDWRLRDYSPGKVQLELMLRWCIENRVNSFDLLGNAASYKSGWSNTEVALIDHQESFSVLGRAHASVWTRRMRPAVKKVIEALPADTRRKIFS